MSKVKESWSTEAKELAIKLHSELSLNDQNWHKLKSNHNRRAAELLAGSLVQLLANGKISDIEAQILQATRWLNHEVNDPGCPNH